MNRSPLTMSGHLTTCSRYCGVRHCTGCGGTASHGSSRCSRCGRGRFLFTLTPR